MRLSLLIDFLIFNNTLSTNDPADRIEVKEKVEESSLTATTRHFPIVIADSTTDQAIGLPDSPTDYLLILTDQEISIKINGSSDAMTLKPKIAGKRTPVFMFRGSLTGLSVSNSSGNSANLDVVLVVI
jgi:hypothetical protein